MNLPGILVVLICGWLSGIGSQVMTDPVLARGCEAVTANPAALVLNGNPAASLRYFGVRLHAGNNLVRLSDYGRYFRHPVRLTEDDKQQILDRIGAGPLRLRTGVEYQVLHGHYRLLGWALDYKEYVVQSLPRSLFELALEGNELNRTYRLDGLGFDTLSFLRASVAGGYALGPGSVGLGLSWLHGFRYTVTTSSAGELLTTPYAITGCSHQSRDQAGGGDGFGVTIGGALRLGRYWQLGLSIRDLGAGIWWHGNPGVREITTELESLDVYRYYEEPILDSFVIHTDSFLPRGTIWMRVPGALATGIGFSPGRVLSLGLLVNLPLGWNRFIDEPPLAGLRVQLRPLYHLGLDALAGWHRQKGWVGQLAIGTHYRGVEFSVGAELRGRSPGEAKDAAVNLALGYDF